MVLAIAHEVVAMLFSLRMLNLFGVSCAIFCPNCRRFTFSLCRLWSTWLLNLTLCGADRSFACYASLLDLTSYLEALGSKVVVDQVWDALSLVDSLVAG